MVAGRIPQSFIQELLLRVDVVSLIDSLVPLKKTGANFVARCPFHAEKTPSFSVNQKKQFYHCFGCGASGNAIGFLIAFNHLNFIEAVEALADFAGVDVPRQSSVDDSEGLSKSELERLFQVMERVAHFYVKQLRASDDGRKGVAYLKQRGIEGSIAQDFLLGYAPENWRILLEQFERRELEQVGLLGINEKGEYYARFRNRIMFPIRDKRARIVGFGGRVLDSSLPKYLNSPDTVLFHKSREIYGLNEVIKVNSRPLRILIVEGYMDVLALHQLGLTYSVATLGTAISQVHVELLFRFSSELVFCFDGDNAGRAAAWKALGVVISLLKDGRVVRFMTLPQQHDPDSLVREEGAERFVDRMTHAPVFSDYFFAPYEKDLKAPEAELRSRSIKEVKTYLARLPIGAFRDEMFERLSGLIKRQVVDSDSNLAYKDQQKTYRRRSPRPSLPSLVMAMLLQNPWLVDVVEQKEINLDQLEFEGADKFINILQVIREYKPTNCGLLTEIFRDHADQAIVDKLVSLDLLIPDDGIAIEFADALDKLLAMARAVSTEKLLVRAKQNQLTPEEKKQLLQMLADK